MPGLTGSRPFLPSQLMNPMLGSFSFPWAAGLGSKLPPAPANPVAKPQPVHTTKADANGIQAAMAKRAANMNLGKVPQGAGPQQMFNALSMLGQARALVDPEKTLKQEGLARGDFESTIDRLAKKDGERYDFKAEKQDPKNQAIIKGLLGALAGGGVGYLGGGGGLGSTLAGAAVGGAGGAGIGALGARSHNRKLHSTAKVLKNYGLLQPEYLRAALPLLKQGATKRAGITRNSLPFALGGAALGGLGGAIYNQFRDEDEERPMWKDVLTGAGGGAGAGFAANLAGNAAFDNDLGLRAGLGLKGDKLLTLLAALGGGVGGGAIGGGFTEGLHSGNEEEEKEAAQDNSAQRLSATGEDSGVSFKHDNEGHLTGADAFKSLDSHMKKAGMNSFQRQFFGRLIQQGMDDTMIEAAVKTACDRFGDKVAADLNDGLDIMEKTAILRAVLQGIGTLGRKLIPGAVRQVARKPGVAMKTLGRGTVEGAKRMAAPAINQAKQLPGRMANAAKATPGAVKDFGKGLATKPNIQTPSSGFGAGVFSRPQLMGNAIRQQAGRMATGTGQALKNNLGTRKGLEKLIGTRTPYRSMSQMATGAGTGFFNPYTGVTSDAAWNDDGSLNWQHLLQQTAGGALLGRIPGAQNMMRRGMAGEGLGYLGGAGANYMGYDVDPMDWARGGFALGGLSGLKGVPGYNNKAITRGLSRYAPDQMLLRGTGKALTSAGKAAWRNPGTTAAIAGGLGTPAATMWGFNKLNETANQAQKDVQNQLHGYKKQLQQKWEPRLEEAVSSATQASNRVNNLLGGGGEGSGGIGNMLSGMFGNVGQYLQNNPIAMLALLGGLGGLGGYGLGGAGGATMGGIGLPLIYLMATGQLGNMGGQQQASTGQNAASTQATRDQAMVDAQVANQLRSGNVAQLPQQQMPQNEIQRQMMQQRMAMA